MFRGPICVFTVQWCWKKKSHHYPPNPPFHPVFRLQLWLQEQLTKRLWTIVINVLHRSGRTMGGGGQNPPTIFKFELNLLSHLSHIPDRSFCSCLHKIAYIFFCVYLFMCCWTLCTSPQPFDSSCGHGREGSAVFRRKYAMDRCISSSGSLRHCLHSAGRCSLAYSLRFPWRRSVRLLCVQAISGG